MSRSRWGAGFALLPGYRQLLGHAASRPGFAGPLGLLAVGLGLGLVAAPGPWPDPPTLVSLGLALLVYGAALRLASAGRADVVVAIVVAVALGLAVLAFGPGPSPDRKITAFNAWAYSLGGWLPPWISPPPHPNAAAGVLAVALGLTGAAASPASGHARRAVPGIVALAGALLLTASRAGWLAGAAAVLVLVGAWRPRAARVGMALLGLTVVVLVSVVLADPEVAAGPGPLLSTYSLTVRWQQWDQTRALLADRPLFGLGLARFPYAYAAAVAGSGRRPYETPANTLLQVWADAGLVGLAALAWISWRAIRLLRPAPTAPETGWLRLGLAAALAALAVDGLFESVTAIVWRTGDGYGYLASPLPFLLLGLLAGNAHRGSLPGAPASDHPPRKGHNEEDCSIRVGA